MLNYFLGIAGIPPQNWLNDPNLALISLVIVTIWGSIGSNMVIFLAGLQDIPRDIIEAARVDGANPLQSFLFITVPLMRPVILFVVCDIHYRYLPQLWLDLHADSGRPLQPHQYHGLGSVSECLRLSAFGGEGAAISVVMLVIVLILTLISFRVLRERQGA